MSTPPHVQTALSLLSTFATLDVATCIALRTPSCTWHMRPTSLGYPASMNNAEHEKHLTFIASLLERFPVTVLEWWEGEGSYSGEGLDESEGKGGVRRGKTVSVLAKSVGVFKKEVRGEFLFFFPFGQSDFLSWWDRGLGVLLLVRAACSSHTRPYGTTNPLC
jgi:hypothetical protein